MNKLCIKTNRFKSAKTDFNGSLKDLYSKVVAQLKLTYRPQQLYLSEIILDQLMHSDKAMIEAPLEVASP